MATASIALPRIMRVGGGASQEIGAVLQGLGLQRPLIVTDNFLLNHGQVDRFKTALESSGITAAVVALHLIVRVQVEHLQTLTHCT